MTSEELKKYQNALDAISALLNLRHSNGAQVIPKCLERTNAEYAIAVYNNDLKKEKEIGSSS